MKNFYTKKWPDLDQFMTICFHEDMDYEFPAASPRESAKMAVEDFLRTNPRKQVERVYIELKELLNQSKSEDELADALLAMYCRWDFRPYRTWVESLMVQIGSFLRPAEPKRVIKADAEDPKSIAGNTSDDRLRRIGARRAQFHVSGRLINFLIVLLMIAACWEIAFRYVRASYAGSGVEVSRFGGFVSMFRQLLGSKPSSPSVNVQSSSLPVAKRNPTSMGITETRGGAPHRNGANLSKIMRAFHKRRSTIEDAYTFLIDLHKEDGWFDTGIPVIAGNWIDVITIKEEPRASIRAKVNQTEKWLRLEPTNRLQFPMIGFYVVDHEVGAEHVLLSPGVLSTLKLKLSDDPDSDHVVVQTTLSIYDNQGMPEMKGRERTMLKRFVKE